MNTLGLIGNPISHSRSPEIFLRLFAQDNLSDFEYKLFPLSTIEELPELISSQPNLGGFNVTIPFKTAIIQYLTELDFSAQELGAVNTVKVLRTHGEIQLKGYNTDTYGFEKSLLEFLGKTSVNALVLGTGGASKAVCDVLEKLNIPYTAVSRHQTEHAISYNQLDSESILKHTLIINTTPLGMKPYETAKPNLPYAAIGSQHYCYDLIYSPETTAFLSECKKRGAKTINGWNMLNYQAEKAWEIFRL